MNGRLFLPDRCRAVGLLILMIISYMAFCRHVRTLRFEHVPKIHSLLQSAPALITQLRWQHEGRQILNSHQLRYPHLRSIVAYTMVTMRIQNVEIVSLLTDEQQCLLTIVSRDQRITWIDTEFPKPEELQDDPTLPWALTPFEERLVYDIFLLARRHAKALSR